MGKKSSTPTCHASRVEGCINRDKNSVMNMERIVKGLLMTGERLPIFRRTKSGIPIPNIKIILNGGNISDANSANRQPNKKINNK